MRPILTSLAAVTLFGVSASPAFAYQQWTSVAGPVHWAGDNPFAVLYYPSEFDDSPDYFDAAIDAVARFNVNPSALGISLALDDDADQSPGNGESEITWTDDQAVLGGAPARQLGWFNSDTGEWLEADVYIDRNQSWTVSDRKAVMSHYGGTLRPFQTALMHELGHVAGLGHEDSVYNLMGWEWSHTIANGPWATPHLGSDIAAGLIATYGAYAYDDLYDLSVTHWEWDPGTTGDYAWTRRTTVTDGYGASLPSRSIRGEPYFEVEPGVTYIFPFTLENAGPERVNVEATVVLSHDAYIDASDPQIGWLWDYCDPGDPQQALYGVTLPADITPGRYYVGLIFDSGDAVSEIDEENNASYIGILVF